MNYGDPGSDCRTVKSSMATSTPRTDLVRAFFDSPYRYLTGRRFDIRIRADSVRTFTHGRSCRSILDIGCGDGSISLPLLGRETRVTLLDFSASMLSIAQSNVPRELAGDVEVRNEDFMSAAFDPSGFDLIICLGVLAHVDSPEGLIRKTATLLRPGGSLILEFTDSFHFMGRLSRMMGWLKELVAPPRSPVNLLSFAQVDSLLSRHGFRLVSQFRYAYPPLEGIQRMLPQNILFEIVRLLFGTCEHHRNSWFGNEYICLLTLDPARNGRAS